jgi:putative PEP-CTERM system histidine kinase
MSEELTVGLSGSAIAFGGYALACALFTALIFWRSRSGVRLPAQRLLLGGFAITACWAWLSAIGPGSTLAGLAETARNLVWLGLLHSLSGGRDMLDRQRGVRLVYGAVAAVLGLEIILELTPLVTGIEPTLAATATLLRMTAAAGLLVLVHNLYGQADTSGRSAIGMAMLALVATWGYDLNLYTLRYLDPVAAGGLGEWRGLVIACTVPLFAIGAKHADGWRIHLSRAATFQSLSLLAICAYFAVMAILATALGRAGIDWTRPLLAAVLAVMVVIAMVLIPSSRARAWARVKLAKHFFEHRYDYRTEWLRFAETVGGSGKGVAPLGERLIKAFADIVEAPGGLLLVADDPAGVALAASWNWTGADFDSDGHDLLRWRELERAPRILDINALRDGDPRGGSHLPLPGWLQHDRSAWAGVPLMHDGRLVGLVLLAAPDYRRALDWEDFDLLRTAGNQAASTLAEAHGQAALGRAQRFDEFNRRFAFILHDVKNLVSQLSLLTRNAERHADNPDFRADMIATLKGSVGKMNDLLARLGTTAEQRPARLEPIALRALVAAAIAGKRARHDIELLGDGDQLAMADPLLLEQAIGHLVQNAIDASTVRDPVQVRMGGDANSATIIVADRGVGMDADFIRTQLFEPFASTKDGGFGIGAFEARALIQSMGGRLTVESRPGKGTKFTIHLAVAPADEAAFRKIA